MSEFSEHSGFKKPSSSHGDSTDNLRTRLAALEKKQLEDLRNLAAVQKAHIEARDANIEALKADLEECKTRLVMKNKELDEMGRLVVSRGQALRRLEAKMSSCASCSQRID